MGTIREPIVEGIFYPSDKDKLHRLVKNLVDNAITPRDDAFAVIAPHAGYRYSGALAAAAFKAASGRKIKNVVILAPIHRNPQDEVIFPESDHFRIPATLIPINHRLIDEIIHFSTQFCMNDIPHLEEHAIEVQLPFIYHLFPDSSVIPVLVGKIGKKTVTVLERALTLATEAERDKTLFVVSSNLTSFMQGKDAKMQADLILRFILGNDPESLLLAHEAGTINTCSASAIAVLLSLSAGCHERIVISSGSSAETNRDFGELVHYAAIGFFQREK